MFNGASQINMSSSQVGVIRSIPTCFRSVHQEDPSRRRSDGVPWTDQIPHPIRGQWGQGSGVHQDECVQETYSEWIRIISVRNLSEWIRRSFIFLSEVHHNVIESQYQFNLSFISIIFCLKFIRLNSKIIYFLPKVYLNECEGQASDESARLNPKINHSKFFGSIDRNFGSYQKWNNAWAICGWNRSVASYQKMKQCLIHPSMKSLRSVGQTVDLVPGGLLDVFEHHEMFTSITLADAIAASTCVAAESKPADEDEDQEDPSAEHGIPKINHNYDEHGIHILHLHEMNEPLEPFDLAIFWKYIEF